MAFFGPTCIVRGICHGLAAAAAAFVLSGDAQAGPTERVTSEPVTVAFLNPGKRGETFWDMLTQTMDAAARQLNITLEVVHAERNHRVMQTQGHEILERAVPPQFLIVTNEDNAGVALLEAAESKGVRTLLILSDVLGEDWQRLGGPRDMLKSWIGSLISDMEAAGARMAKHLVMAAREKNLVSQDGKLHLLVLTADESSPAAKDRLRGFNRYIAKEPDVVVDRVLHAHWNAADAERLTAKYLAWAKRRGVRVAGIWSGNDPMALGAMKAVKAAHLVPGRDVMLVGLNWSQEAVAHVKDGSMVSTDGGHFLLGTWSMIMLRDQFDGCDVFRASVPNWLPTADITQDNAARILPLLAGNQFTRADVAQLRAKAEDRTCRPYDYSLEKLLASIGSPKTE